VVGLTLASRHRMQAVFLFMRVGAAGSAPPTGGTVIPLAEAIALELLSNPGTCWRRSS
jgi:hypothetical protein